MKRIFFAAIIIAATAIFYYMWSYPNAVDIKNKVEIFLTNPEMCASTNHDYYKAAKKLKWNKETMNLIENVNAMPKKITFFIQKKISHENIANLSYRVDADCAGLWMNILQAP